MTLSYGSSSVFTTIFFGWKHSAIRAAWRTPFFRLTCIIYTVCCLIFHFYLPVGFAGVILGAGYLTYGLGFLGGFITFNQVFFNSQCYSRFVSNWTAAMKQWSRLNDLGLQVYAHMSYDHFTACEVMRLMHAANTFVTLEAVLKIDKERVLGVVFARKLLNTEEAACLQECSTLNRGYQCVCWALQLVSAETRAKRLDSMLAARMDQSICEWRQNATLPALMGETPIPYTYFHTMAVLKFVFNTLLAMRLALSAVPVGPREVVDPALEPLAPLMGEHGSQWVHFAIATFVLPVMVLSLDSLFESARQLADPWGTDAVDLPGGEYILRCLQGHKVLFREATAVMQPPKLGHGTKPTGAAGTGVSLFLEALQPSDQEFLASTKVMALEGINKGMRGKLVRMGTVMENGASQVKEAAKAQLERDKLARMNGIASEAVSALESGLKSANNLVEEITGFDINGDGYVGGKDGTRVPQFTGAPTMNPTSSARVAPAPPRAGGRTDTSTISSNRDTGGRTGTSTISGNPAGVCSCSGTCAGWPSGLSMPTSSMGAGASFSMKAMGG